MQKHPKVRAFEKKTGCEAVDQGGSPFALIPDDKDLPKLPNGKPKYPALESASAVEKARGRRLVICRGKVLGAK